MTNAEEKTPPWYSCSPEEAVQILESDEEQGLSDAEVERRREKTGPNRLAAPPGKPWWKEIAEEVTEPMILLLLAVGVVYGFLGELRDAITIIVIIAAVLAIEIGNESRAKGAINALSKFTVLLSPVLRNGKYEETPAADLVPGDVVLLRAGERIPADLRLLETVGLRVDESSLTGESAAVGKEADATLPEATALGDRRNLAFSGTLVTGGKGKGLVVATGMSTELGRIAGLVKKASEPRTPLQLHMRELTQWMVWIALGFSVLTAIVSWVQGAGWKDSLLTALTLAFATIPEELPILIAMVLGLGAYRLSKERAIIRRLKTAESLGNLSVVATDKTGTLTQNNMRVDKWFIGGEWLDQQRWESSAWTDLAMQIGMLANDTVVAGKHSGTLTFEGDPTDTAFYHAARQAGYDVVKIKNECRLIGEMPLDERNRRIAVTVQKGDSRFIMCKGAPEALLQDSDRAVVHHEAVPLNDELRLHFTKQAEALAAEGYRVLALAYGENGFVHEEQNDQGLIFVGLAALLDPPREDAVEAVCALHSAGVKVMMITGDHGATAQAIARQVGIPAAEVLLGSEMDRMTDEVLTGRLTNTFIAARTTPEQKLRIVRVLQEQGEVVAVTGDGVNDGPALKEADIGIAMGKSGTDAAKESADMILSDDSFSTVTLAVKEGRKLFANLHKAVKYYLAAKVALILSTLLPVIAGWPLPFAPIHIIMMELFMDLGASVSFVAEKQESDAMRRYPRRSAQKFMDKTMVFGIFSGGATLAVAILAAYMWSILSGAGAAHAQTVAFATWMAGHVLLAMMMRSESEPLLRFGVWSNKVHLVWTASAFVFLAIALYVPFLGDLLHLASANGSDWMIILPCSVLAPLWLEIRKMIYWKKQRQAGDRLGPGAFVDRFFV